MVLWSLALYNNHKARLQLTEVLSKQKLEYRSEWRVSVEQTISAIEQTKKSVRSIKLLQKLFVLVKVAEILIFIEKINCQRRNKLIFKIKTSHHRYNTVVLATKNLLYLYIITSTLRVHFYLIQGLQRPHT